MRIISGAWKGRRIQAPKSLPVRPTTDFAKEALFNILTNRLDFSAISVLDLFSGTGNISFEFGSRGVKNITAIDGHFKCVHFIKKCALELGLAIHVVKSDVYKYLENLSKPFDLIFADPPYDFEQEQLEKLISKIMDNELLEEEGTFILEHSKYINFDSNSYFYELRKYGNSTFSFFKKEINK